MCGRVTSTFERHEFALLFGLPLPDAFTPSVDVRPTEPTPLLRLDARGRREVALVRWGLVPEWHQGSLREWRAASFNARSEDVTDRPAFRAPFRRRRGLMIVSGFYEWVEQDRFLITRRDARPLVFAAVWDRWSRDGQTVESCALLTCDANLEVSEVHDRMPVVLLSRDWDAWLNPLMPARELQRLMRPLQPGVLQVQPALTALQPKRQGVNSRPGR